jgi:hypothetical protein
VAKLGIGTETASALLVATGDVNPQRLRNECTFGDLCGTARKARLSRWKRVRHAWTAPAEFRRRAVELARELDDDGKRKHPIAQLARDRRVVSAELARGR